MKGGLPTSLPSTAPRAAPPRTWTPTSGWSAAAPGDLALFPEMSLTSDLDPLRHFTTARPARRTQPCSPCGSHRDLRRVRLFRHRRNRYRKPGLHHPAGGRRRRTARRAGQALPAGEDAFTPSSGDALFDYGGIRFRVVICAEAHHDAALRAAASNAASGRAWSGELAEPLPVPACLSGSRAGGGPAVPCSRAGGWVRSIPPGTGRPRNWPGSGW
jgi:hypothetical protein